MQSEKTSRHYRAVSLSRDYRTHKEFLFSALAFNRGLLPILDKKAHSSNGRCFLLYMLSTANLVRISILVWQHDSDHLG
jgi:hypothetical protein